MNWLYVAILFDYLLSINDNFRGGKEFWWYGLSEGEILIIFQLPADDGKFYWRITKMHRQYLARD